MFEAKKKTIEAKGSDLKLDIEVNPFTGSRANKYFVRLFQCLDVRSKAIVCSPEEWQAFCLDFLAFTKINNVSVSSTEGFDQAFTGAIGMVLDVIFFVAEVNGFLVSSATGPTDPAAPTKTE